MSIDSQLLVNICNQKVEDLRALLLSVNEYDGTSLLNLRVFNQEKNRLEEQMRLLDVHIEIDRRIEICVAYQKLCTTYEGLLSSETFEMPSAGFMGRMQDEGRGKTLSPAMAQVVQRAKGTKAQEKAKILEEIVNLRKNKIDIWEKEIRQVMGENAENEATWTEKTRQIVQGNADVQKRLQYEGLFVRTPELLLDYREQLITIIEMLIKMFLLIANFCANVNKDIPVIRKFSIQDALEEIVAILEDSQTLSYLDGLLNLKIETFYNEAQGALLAPAKNTEVKKNNRLQNIVGNTIKPEQLIEVFRFFDIVIRRMEVIEKAVHLHQIQPLDDNFNSKMTAGRKILEQSIDELNQRLQKIDIRLKQQSHNYLKVAQKVYKFLLIKYEMAQKIYDHFDTLVDSKDLLEEMGLVPEVNNLWDLFEKTLKGGGQAEIQSKHTMDQKVDQLLVGQPIRGGEPYLLIRTISANAGNMKGLEGYLSSLVNANSTPISDKRTSMLSTINTPRLSSSMNMPFSDKRASTMSTLSIASVNSTSVRPLSAFMEQVRMNLGSLALDVQHGLGKRVYGENFIHLRTMEVVEKTSAEAVEPEEVSCRIKTELDWQLPRHLPSGETSSHATTFSRDTRSHSFSWSKRTVGNGLAYQPAQPSISTVDDKAPTLSTQIEGEKKKSTERGRAFSLSVTLGMRNSTPAAALRPATSSHPKPGGGNT